MTLPAKLRIYVSKEDIKNGTPHLYDLCPVALSLKRRLPKGYKVGVSDTGRVDITSKHNMVNSYSYSDKVIALIRKYDQTGDFKPCHILLKFEDRY